MIPVTPSLAIDPAALEEVFVRASGPGGQNVNMVSTAVQLRFDLKRTTHWPEPVRVRLRRLAGQRLNQDDVIIISAQRHRTRELNRADARERLFGLIREAAQPVKARRPTKPTRSSQRARLESKKRDAHTKRLRSRPEE